MKTSEPSLPAETYEVLRRHTAGRPGSAMRAELVVQGGAMRGIYSMAALEALAELGLSHSFDAVYGSSAGAINGAYFLSEQTSLAVSVYSDDLCGQQFINPARLWRIADLDYLVDVVLAHRKPLNLKAVLASPSDLYLTLTRVRGALPVCKQHRECGAQLLKWLKAGAAMPIFYPRPLVLSGEQYLDGSVGMPIPIPTDSAPKPSVLVVILTRPLTWRRRPPNAVWRVLVRTMFWREPALADLILRQESLVNRSMNFLSTFTASDNMRLVVVAPRTPAGILSNFTTNRTRLLAAAQAAREDVHHALGLRDPR